LGGREKQAVPDTNGSILKEYVTVTVAKGVKEHAHLYRFADRRRRHLGRSPAGILSKFREPAAGAFSTSVTGRPGYWHALQEQLVPLEVQLQV
jgi:hypothetical protein